VINFKDFFPQMIQKERFPADDRYETFSNLLVKVNQWLLEEEVQLINIETVVLRDSDGERTRFLAEEPFFYQFIRVWYEVKDEATSETEAQSPS